MKLIPPKYDSGVYGYRTKRLSKNEKNWAIAQNKSSNALIFFGILNFFNTNY